MIYATGPRLVTAGSDRYVAKGSGEPLMVLAEVVGYEVARLFDVLTPDWQLLRDPDKDGGHLFGSQYFEEAIDAGPLLHSKELDFAMVGRAIAVDVLLGNPDRNYNSLLMVPGGDQQQLLCVIDFERAEIVRLEAPTIQMKAPSTYLPREDLGRILKPRSAELLAGAMQAAKRAVDVASTLEVVGRLAETLSIPAARTDTITSALRSRTARLSAMLSTIRGL